LLSLNFLDKSDDGQCSTSLKTSAIELNNELVIIHCDECDKDIPADNWDEHTDYHVALKIQKSINHLSPSTNPLSSPQPVRHKSVRKSSESTNISKKSKKCSTLDKFLTKK